MNGITGLDIVTLQGDGTLRDISHGLYPSGEPIVAVPADHPQAILLRPRDMNAFLAGLFWVDALVERGQRIPHLVLPFIPGARQDRLNQTHGDYLFTAKSIAQMVNARNFPTVVVLDPHSDVAPALIDRCVTVHAAVTALDLPSKYYAGVIAPDAGAVKRAAMFAKALGVPVYHGGKSRDVSTGEITDFWLHNVQPGHYLVVDDICDGGGTFVGLAHEIWKAGATADLYVTHGLFSRGTVPLLDCYSSVYCTDSIVGPKQGVTVLNICETLLRKCL